MTGWARFFSRKTGWQADYLRQAADLVVVSGFDPFEDWSRNIMPEGTANDGLRLGLEVCYGCGDETLSRTFLEQGLAVARRALSEGSRLASGQLAGSFPLNRGSLRRAEVYASTLLGSPFNRDQLLEAGADLLEWCRGCGEGEWDSQEEAYLLEAARSLLIAGNFAGAGRELEREFSWHQTEASLLGRLCVAESWSAAESGQARAFFESLRQPRYRPDIFMHVHIVRFEWAVLLACERGPAGFRIELAKVCEAVRNGWR